jgi:hypothetical protein
MEWTVHYRMKDDPKGKTNQRLCRTEADAAKEARKVVAEGGRVAFITDGEGVRLTDEQIRAILT